MEHPLELLEAFRNSYGYWLFFAVGFAEFAGVPIVSVPVLIGGGALIATGSLGFWKVVLSVAAGGWLADFGWYSMGRRRGGWLIDVACGLSFNPMSCVSSVKSRLSRMGTPYILISKMLPGSGNLIAVAAGSAGFGVRRFIIADGAALILWAAIYTGTGWIFSSQVTPAIDWAMRYNRVVVVVLTVIFVGVASRLWKARFHQEGLRRVHSKPLAGRCARADGLRDLIGAQDRPVPSTGQRTDIRPGLDELATPGSLAYSRRTERGFA